MKQERKWERKRAEEEMAPDCLSPSLTTLGQEGICVGDVKTATAMGVERARTLNARGWEGRGENTRDG